MKKYQLPTLNDVREFYEDEKVFPFARGLGLWEELEGDDYLFLCGIYALYLEKSTLSMKESRELSNHLKTLCMQKGWINGRLRDGN